MNQAILNEKIADFAEILAENGREILLVGKRVTAIVVPAMTTEDFVEGGFQDGTNWQVKIALGVFKHTPKKGETGEWDGSRWRIVGVMEHPALPFIAFNMTTADE